MNLIKQPIIKKIFSYILIKSKLIEIIKNIQLFLIDNTLEEPKPRIGVYPYISGDAFLALSDIAYIQSSRIPIPLRINKKPKICFFEVDIFNQLVDISILYVYKVIILHNSDSCPDLEKVKCLSKIGIKVFAININQKINNVTTIPIGLENSHLRRNGSIHFYNPLRLSERSKKDNLLLVSFSVKTNFKERNRISDICSKHGYKNIHYQMLQYRNQLLRSFFVVSPPGNGIDCHRTWEACYLKCVPIIEKKYYLFDHVDLPILIVDDYQEFFALSYEQQIKLYSEITSSDVSAIYMECWSNKIINS